MNDVDTQLTALFDEIAASIDPKPDFDAVLAGTVGAATGGAGAPTGRRLRRALAVAAAAAVVLGGAAAAFQIDREPSMLATADQPIDAPGEPAPKPVVADDATKPAPDDGKGAPVDSTVGTATDTVAGPSAELGTGRLDTDPVRQIVHGRSAPGTLVAISTTFGGTETTVGTDGRWKVLLELPGVPASTLVPIEVAFDDGTVIELTIVTPAAAPPAQKPEPEPVTTVAGETKPDPKADPKPEQPKPDPKEQPPASVPFTASLGAGYPDASPMKQVVTGTATPGTKVLVTSAYGHTSVEAGKNGGWEAHLKMHDVPGGTDVRITVTASGVAKEFEFWVRRPMPEAKPFSAAISGQWLDGDPVKVMFQGTGTPGSKVAASSPHGSAETAIGGGGGWELKLLMPGVPAGTTVNIRVSDSVSGTSKDFSVTTSAAPAPKYHFKANAAYVDCDEAIPYNEYWGTATPGATITISSPYGGGQVTADGSGAWSARIEFPSAPVGQKFQVALASSKDSQTFSFGFTRL